MAIQRKHLEAWVSEFSGKYCRDCLENCCNGARQLINLDIDSIELFEEKGLPNYHMEDDLDRKSVYDWLIAGMHRGLERKSGDHFIGDIKFRDGKIVKKPAIIWIPRITSCSTNGIEFGDSFTPVLYLEKYCPFYNKEIGCEEYTNPRRPDACKHYPLSILEIEDKLMVQFQETCPKSRQGVADLKKRFPDLIIDFY